MIYELFERYPTLEVCRKDILRACQMLILCYEKKNKVLICGNGGSCADANHMVGELMKSFVAPRPLPSPLLGKITELFPEKAEEMTSTLQQPLPAIALSEHSALTTAYINDCKAEYVYAQQLLGYAQKGDVFIGISTSGNAQNVCNAFCMAKVLGLPSILLTGRHGGTARKLADVSICVPETETYKIQEYHLPIYHALCLEVEDALFRKENV